MPFHTSVCANSLHFNSPSDEHRLARCWLCILHMPFSQERMSGMGHTLVPKPTLPHLPADTQSIR